MKSNSQNNSGKETKKKSIPKSGGESVVRGSEEDLDRRWEETKELIRTQVPKPHRYK